MTSFPVKKGKTKVSAMNLHYAVLRHEDKFLVHQRAQTGIWAGLYDFPFMETDDQHVALQHFNLLLDRHDLIWVDGNRYNHVLSHRKISAFFHETLCESMLLENHTWKSAEQLVNSGVSALLKKYLLNHHIR